MWEQNQHDPRFCPFKNYTCKVCLVIGYLANRMCKQKGRFGASTTSKISKKSEKYGKNKRGNPYFLDSEEFMFSIERIDGNPESGYKVPLLLNDSVMICEVDIGRSTIIPLSLFKETFSPLVLTPTTKPFVSYFQESSNLLVHIKYQ